MMTQDEIQKLERLLSREVIKDNLAKAGVYSVAYEFLQYSIIRRPKNFFTMGGVDSDDEYKAEILNRNPKSPLMASCLWLKDQGILTDEDITDIRAFRKHRTDIAHQLLNVLLNTEVQVDEEKLARLFALLCRIDQWWLLNFEIPINPDFDGQDIDPSEVRSGQMEALWYLIRTVYGFDPPSSPVSAQQS